MVRLILLALFLSTASAPLVYAHPVESCGAPVFGPSQEWTPFLESSLGAELVVYAFPDGQPVPENRYTSGLIDGFTGFTDLARWSSEEAAWATSGPRWLYEFRPSPPHDLTHVSFVNWPRPAAGYSFYQRDVRGYDEQGREISDTREDFVAESNGEPGRWVPNRRVVYQRHSSGVFASYRFERFTQGEGWRLSYRSEASFDEQGNRIRCEFFSTDDEGASPYLRYVSTFDGAGRMLSVVRAGDDSTTVSYNVGGMLDTTVRYARGSDGRWTPTERETGQYDASGQLAETLEERRDGDSWGLWERTRYAYRADGLPEEVLRERFDGAAWQPVSRRVYTADLNPTSEDDTSPSERLIGLDVSVHPNPAASLAHVRLRFGAATVAALRVFDSNGRLVATLADGEPMADQTTHVLDVSGFAPGVYVVSATTGDDRVSRPLVVVR